MNAESIVQCARTILSDVSGVKFSDVQLQTALAQVLADVDSKVPHVLRLQFTATAIDQVLIFPDGTTVRNVLSVACMNDDMVHNVAFRFDANSPGNVQLLDEVQASDLNWNVKVVTGHQIDGLDGAETSTILDHCEMLMAIGTTAYALQMRNTQLAESANQETIHYQAIQQNMHVYKEQFQNMLLAWQSAQPPIEPVLPDGPGWQLDH